MNVEEILTDIAEHEVQVKEAGRKAQYNKFWDALQKNGEPMDYSWYGSGITWTDEIYDPKYPIICTAFFNLFRNARITDTKVPIDISRVTSGTHLCFEMPNIVNIPKVIVSENTPLTYCFYACYNLKEIRFEGVIGKSLDLHFSTKLSFESVDNITNCLSASNDIAEFTLTLPSAVKSVYEAHYGEGIWDFIKATKPKCAISFM